VLSVNGLATWPLYVSEVAGMAASYTSIFFRLLFQDDGGDDGNGDGGNNSVLSYLIRALVAFLKIWAKLPKSKEGELPTLGELLVSWLGESWATWIEENLRKITNLPEINNQLQGVIGWLYVVLVVAMLLGIVTYWRAYTAQSEGGYSSTEKIWANQTLIVDPLSWFFKRLVPFSIILAVPLFILSQLIGFLWGALQFVIEYGYEASGTTFAGSIEDFLAKIAEQGGIGIWGLYFIFLLMAIVLIWTGWKFAVRLLKWILATFVAGFNLGLWLDGSKLRSVLGPFSTWLKAVLELAGTVLIIFAIPLLIGSLPEIWAFFFLLLGLLFAAQYVEWTRDWFGGEGKISVTAAQVLNPTWIDDIEARPSRGPVELRVEDVTTPVSSAVRSVRDTVVGATEAGLTSISPEYRVGKTILRTGQQVLGRPPESPAYQRGFQAIQSLRRPPDKPADSIISLAESMKFLGWYREGETRTVQDFAKLYLLAEYANLQGLTGNCSQCGAPLPELGIVCAYCRTPQLTRERALQDVQAKLSQMRPEEIREYGRMGASLIQHLH